MTIPPLPTRRSIRLPGFDYSNAGLYFITLVTANRECIFGHIIDDQLWLNQLGLETMAVWQEIQRTNPCVALVDSVLMPNHFHGLVWLQSGMDLQAGSAGGSTHFQSGINSGKTRPYKKTSLAEIVRAFKSFSARRINFIRRTPGQPVWQRNYYEHIVRNDVDGQHIIEYIAANPAQWENDPEYHTS